MDGFSVSSLTSLSTAISHSVLARASELSDVLGAAPAGYHADQLRSLAQSLRTFSATIGHFEQCLTDASAMAPDLQSQIRQSLETCQGGLAPMGKQIAARLDPGSVEMLNTMFVTAHLDFLAEHTHLVRFFEQVLSMTSRGEQDAALGGPDAQRVVEQAADSTRMLSKAGDIVAGSDGLGGPAPPQDFGDLPPPYEEAPASSSAKGAEPPSANASSSASASAASTSEPAPASSTWGSSFKDSFRALAAGLRARPHPLANALCEASRRGDVAQISALVKQGALVDGRNEDGKTAFECAISTDQEESARVLLSLGAGTDKTWAKNPPLFQAASAGAVRVAKVLVEKGADPKAKRVTGQPYFADVVASGSVVGVRLLLENGAKATTTHITGRPVIVEAVAKGNFDMTKLLLDHGASPNTQDITGSCLLDLALHNRPWSHEMVALLLQKGASPSARTLTGEPLILHAFSRRNVACAKELLEAGANPNVNDLVGTPALIKVLQDSRLSTEDKVEVVRLMINNGAKVTSTNAIQAAMAVYADERVVAVLQEGVSRGL